MAKGKRRKDGYPVLSEALAAVGMEVAETDLPITSVTVQMLASGEVVYRVHKRGDEEGEGGYLLVQDAA